MLLALGVMSSSAAALTRAGTFSCTATAADVFGTPFVVANPANSPCASDKLAGLAPTVLGITPGVLHALTILQAGPLPSVRDQDLAAATVAGVQITTIPGHTITVGALDSQAQEGCGRVPPGATLVLNSRSSSNVASLTIDGTPQTVGSSPLTIAVDGAASVSINETIPTSNSLTQVALEVDLLGQPIVLGAVSQVDFSGNPCGTM